VTLGEGRRAGARSTAATAATFASLLRSEIPQLSRGREAAAVAAPMGPQIRSLRDFCSAINDDETVKDIVRLCDDEIMFREFIKEQKRDRGIDGRTLSIVGVQRLVEEFKTLKQEPNPGTVLGSPHPRAQISRTTQAVRISDATVPVHGPSDYSQRQESSCWGDDSDDQDDDDSDDRVSQVKSEDDEESSDEDDEPSEEDEGSSEEEESSRRRSKRQKDLIQGNELSNQSVASRILDRKNSWNKWENVEEWANGDEDHLDGPSALQRSSARRVGSVYFSSLESSGQLLIS
jgi:hypothetical protein